MSSFRDILTTKKLTVDRLKRVRLFFGRLARKPRSTLLVIFHMTLLPRLAETRKRSGRFHQLVSNEKWVGKRMWKSASQIRLIRARYRLLLRISRPVFRVPIPSYPSLVVAAQPPSSPFYRHLHAMSYESPVKTSRARAPEIIFHVLIGTNAI